MRASLKGKHVSGAERIIDEEVIPAAICELLRRPKKHDRLVITIERIHRVEVIEHSLRVNSFEFESTLQAREFALQKLVESEIPKNVAKLGIGLLSRGANPKGGNMRGAVLLDIETGERLEPDKERGIRTVRVDWKDRDRVRRKILEKGMTERSLDALALATKNIHCGVVAELCWSDDPDYLTGYVASKKLGYVRIKPLKESGDPLGGRIYFIRREHLKEIIECLEKKAMLIRSLQV